MNLPIPKRFASLALLACALGLTTVGCVVSDTADPEPLDGASEQLGSQDDRESDATSVSKGGDCRTDRDCVEDDSVCKVGKRATALCSSEQHPDAVLRAALEPMTTGMATSQPLASDEGCDDFAVDWSNPEEARWWDRLVAFVPAEARPDTRCACENMELVVEVEEIACVSAGCMMGSCTDGGPCCNASDCGDGEACIGATPLTDSLCATATAERVATGTFLSGFGCVLSLTIERHDASHGLVFRGIVPHVRAQAIDKVSGARYPVTIAGHND